MRITGRTAEEIAASVEGQLRSARGSGLRLPPVRSLASRLGVSPATVASAYKTLKNRGLTSGSGRRGTRLLPPPPAPIASPRPAPAGTMDLASGNPDPALLPSVEQALR